MKIPFSKIKSVVLRRTAMVLMAPVMVVGNLALIWIGYSVRLFLEVGWLFTLFTFEMLWHPCLVVKRFSEGFKRVWNLG